MTSHIRKLRENIRRKKSGLESTTIKVAKQYGVQYSYSQKTHQELHVIENWHKFNQIYINILKNKGNLLYIRNKSVPRSKHFLPLL
jgi:hypothetical protein